MVFVTYAASVLGDTDLGLSGSQIVDLTAAYAVDADVRIPHGRYPFSQQGINKRTALGQNIAAFAPCWRYKIILELCSHRVIQERNSEEANKLKLSLVSRFGHLSQEASASDLSLAVVEETKHWLSPYPKPLSLYRQAEAKLAHGLFDRNMLDDLRLSLETLLHDLLGNHKSLENQLSALGAFIAQRSGSSELSNMFAKLIEYFGKYQNTYVKHDAAVVQQEVQFMFELTSCFIRHLVRIGGRRSY